MKAPEFLRKLKKLARKRGIELTVTAAKGSHHKVYFGGVQTIVPMHNSELKTGTLNAILKDLGLRERDLYEE